MSTVQKLTSSVIRAAVRVHDAPGRVRARRLATLTLGLVCAGLIALPAVSGGSAQARSRGRAAAAAAHIPTWSFDDGCNGGRGVSGAFVRQWLSFAESNCGPTATKARRDCHPGGRVVCRVMQYLDTDWYFAADGHLAATAASSAGWWLHVSPGVSIRTPANGGGLMVDQNSPAVRAYFRSYVRRWFDQDDGLFMDMQAPGLSEELYYSNCGCSKTVEIRSDRALQRAHEAMSRALRHRDGRPFLQADNALAPNPFLPEGFGMLQHSAGVDGLAGDGIPEQNGVLDPYYSTLLDQLAAVDHRAHAFTLLRSDAPSGAPYVDQSRRVQEATVLLGWRPGHVVDWAALEEGSARLAVWPEEGLVPGRPLESMRAPSGRGCLAGTGALCARGGHHDLEVAHGVFRREFASCTLQGRPIGRCAAIVNTTARSMVSARRWLRRAYHHQIGLVGGDVASGGTLALSGGSFTSGVSVVPAHDALLIRS